MAPQLSPARRRRGPLRRLAAARSAAWQRRAFALAVQAKNTEETIRALIQYGALMRELGCHAEARDAYRRAARRATRTGRRRRAAVALQYRFVIDVETDQIGDAVRDAGAALKLYPRHDERLPFITHCFAWLLVKRSYYRHALRVLARAVMRMSRPHEMRLMFGTTAHATGGAGRVERYHAAERAALELIAVNEEHAAASLVCLAEGARLLGD